VDLAANKGKAASKEEAVDFSDSEEVVAKGEADFSVSN
jgi:hypothetical protein